MFTFCTGQRELKLSLPVKSSKLLFVAKLVDLIRAQLVTRGIMASKKASAQDSLSANSAAELLVRVLFKVVTHQQLGRDEKLVAEDAGKIGVDNLKVRISQVFGQLAGVIKSKGTLVAVPRKLAMDCRAVLL
jgi:hypothetical protein